VDKDQVVEAGMVPFVLFSLLSILVSGFSPTQAQQESPTQAQRESPTQAQRESSLVDSLPGDVAKTVTLVELVASCDDFAGTSVDTAGSIERNEDSGFLICAIPFYLFRDYKNCFSFEIVGSSSFEQESKKRFLTVGGTIYVTGRISCSSRQSRERGSRGQLMNLSRLASDRLGLWTLDWEASR
jgi:hypothetical protein